MQNINPLMFFLQNPLVLLGGGLFVLTSLIASSGRLSKKDPAMLYTFIASLAILGFGVFSSYQKLQMVQQLTNHPELQQPATQPIK